MPEQPTSRKGKLLEWFLRLVPAVGATVAVVALLLALAARKKEITCTYLGASKLVSIEPGGVHPDVKMDFRGTPITSLYKLSFRLKNTGAAAVKQEDVREILRLRFAPGTRLLNSTVERTFPSRFPVSTALSTNDASANIEFPLLNAGDEADIAVFLYNSDPIAPTFEGRVVDVKLFSASESQGDRNSYQPIFRSSAVRSVSRWSFIALYGALSGLAAFLAGLILVEFLRYHRWRKKWGNDYDKLVHEVSTALPARLPAETATDNQTDAHLAGERYRLYKTELSKTLKERDIPPMPSHPLPETLVGAYGGALALLSISAFFALTAYIVHFALG